MFVALPGVPDGHLVCKCGCVCVHLHRVIGQTVPPVCYGLLTARWDVRRVLVCVLELRLSLGDAGAACNSQQLPDAGQHPDAQCDGQQEDAEKGLKVPPAPNTHRMSTNVQLSSI